VTLASLASHCYSRQILTAGLGGQRMACWSTSLPLLWRSSAGWTAATPIITPRTFPERSCLSSWAWIRVPNRPRVRALGPEGVLVLLVLASMAVPRPDTLQKEGGIRVACLEHAAHRPCCCISVQVVYLVLVSLRSVPLRNYIRFAWLTNSGLCHGLLRCS
jgi:hypothetical protein